MFKIGDFSKLTSVSVKMLRHYNDIGLLLPAQVDESTGYRFYTADQLPRLNRIIALKELGFSLEQVKTLLDQPLSAEQLQGMLLLRRAQITEQLRADERRLRNVETRLSQIDQEQHSPYDVIVRDVPPQRMATLRRIVPTDEAIPALFDEVEAFAALHKARATASPLMLYHDAEYRETDMDVEAAVPVLFPIEATAPITVREMPGGRMICSVYTGSYSKTQEVLNALLRWLALHRCKIGGALREVYLRFGADHAEQLNLPTAFLTTHAPLFVTELQLPIESEDDDDALSTLGLQRTARF